MADLTDNQAAQTVRIAGTDITGVEINPITSTDMGNSRRGIEISQADELRTFNNNGQLFVGFSSVLAIGTVETAAYLFKNPSGSGKQVKIVSIYQNTNGTGTVRIYKTPTVTANGTTITPQSLRLQASPPASIANVFSSPTVTSNGTFIMDFVSTAQSGSLGFELLGYLILDANQTILITVQNSANNTNTDIGLQWLEI